MSDITFFDDREQLIIIGMDNWKEHKLFGTGCFSSNFYLQKEGGHLSTSYHNSFIEFLSNTGIVGLMAWINWLVVIYIQPFQNIKNSFNFTVMIYLLGLIPFWIFNTQHQNPINLIILMIIIALTEGNNDNLKQIS